MLFNSYIFIFIFFPLCITGFYLLTRFASATVAKIWLIGLSLWFYGYFSPLYLGVMVLSIAVNYVLIRLMRTDKRRIVLIAGVIFNLGLLGYYKYLDFAITGVNFLLGTDFPLKNILLPLGISFFTFQQIGYLADTYHETDAGILSDVPFVDYALFVSFFPQLVAGPIVSGDKMLPQFKTIAGRRPDPELIGRGLTLFILGLAKKVLIADSFGRAVDTGYASVATLGGLDSFMVMIWYTLQLYFDFSGYCDMARGLASMLGFELPVNFDSPYKATDIVGFWRRWHMTLTGFFTRHVYIPLGGSRRGELRTVVNMFIVYLLSGLWHGAGVNFILWGLLHGIAYVTVRTIMRRRGDRPAGKTLPGSIFRILSHIVTFLYVAMAWVYFRAENVAQGTQLIKNMFTAGWKSISYQLADAFVQIDELWYIVKFTGLPGTHFALAHNLVMIVFTLAGLIIVFAAPNADEVSRRIKPRVIPAMALGVLGLWCVLSFSEVSTFLYFNF